MGSKYEKLANWLERRPERSLELPLTEIESILGFRLAESYRVHPAGWAGGSSIDRPLKAIGWHAYPRLQRDAVIFRRVRAEGSGSVSYVHPSSTSADPEQAPLRGEVLLLGCVKSKRGSPSPAKDMYVSALWNGRRSLAESRGLRWKILSAKHGLLDPDEMIEPYDVALAGQSQVERQAWSNRVFSQLLDEFEDLEGMVFEIHAGWAYSESGLSTSLRAVGARVIRPLEGLLLGEQLAWYQDRSRSRPVSTVSPPDLHSDTREGQYFGGSPPDSVGDVEAGRLGELISSSFFGNRLDLSKRPGAPRPGWDGMPELHAVEELRSQGAPPAEIRLFLTFLSAMDRARDAIRLWNAGTVLWKEDRWPFDPSMVVQKSSTEMRECLAASRVSQRHSADTFAWQVIAESLLSRAVEPVNRVIENGSGDAAELVDSVESRTHSGQPFFPLLTGPKISRMWIRMLANPGQADIGNIDSIPVAVDVQVRRITEYLGITGTGNMSLERARPIIQDAWRAGITTADIGGPERIGGTCAALDPALWFYARWGCTFCERAGRQMPISPACGACRLSPKFIAARRS